MPTPRAAEDIKPAVDKPPPGSTTPPASPSPSPPADKAPHDAGAR
jgi:hypothetical protein